MQADNLKFQVINEKAMEQTQSFIKDCENNYQSQIDDIVQKIIDDKNIKLVLLAGPSSSGKTTTSNIIAKKLGEKGKVAKAIPFDNFYLDQNDSFRFEDGTLDLETIKSLDTNLLIQCLKDLIQNGETMLPEFDFITKTRTIAKTKMTLEKDELIILEGLHALNPLISEDFVLESLIKLYVSVSSRIIDDKGEVVFSKRDLRFIRRLVRDYHYRNSCVDNTLYLWRGVLMGEERYIFPFSHLADYKIDSIHAYEICVFKQGALRLLQNANPQAINYDYSQELIAKLKKCHTLSEQVVPNNSLLVEFIANR